MRSMVDFLIVGTFKAASSTLAYELGRHPAVEIPSPKDPYYFLASLAGSYIAPDGFLKAHYANAITTRPDFQALFGGKPGATIRGEATPLYLYCHDHAISAIQADNPDARIVIVLRNPADRAFSNYQHNVKDGYETRSFAECIATWEETEHLPLHPFFHYVRAGFYDEQVAAYQQSFGRVKIVAYDDVRATPQAVLIQIAQFLGLTPAIEAREMIRLNKSGQPRSRLLHDFIRGESYLKSLLRPLYRAAFRNKATRKAISERLKNLNIKSGEMAQADRAALAALYRDDIARLSDRVGRDFAGQWGL